MIFAFLFVALLGWSLYRFKIRPASGHGELKPLLWPVVAIAGFLLGIAGFSAAERAALYQYEKMSPSQPSVELLRRQHGEVLVEGTVSPTNASVHGDHVACLEVYDDDASTSRSTPAFKIRLADGDIPLENNDYRLMNWHAERSIGRAEYYLRIDDPVVVEGTLVHGVMLLGPDSGRATIGIKAKTVCLGRYGDFVAASARAARVPSWLSVASLTGSLIAALLLPASFLAAWWRLRRTPVSTQPSPSGQPRP